MASPTRVDLLVVGGGAMGLATTWQLARRGLTPLLLDRFPAGHTHGASHGATRNFNNAYGTDHYLDLLVAARRGWEDLSQLAGSELLTLHGLVTHGDDDAVAQVHGALAARGIPSDVLSPDVAAARWPGIRFTRDVLYSPDAGVVRAAAALETLERAAVAAGATVRRGARVRRIVDEGDRVVVAAERDGATDEIVADTVVVTAGAWTPGLLPADVPLPGLTVTEESPAHFAPRRATDAWPSFNHLPPTDDGYPGGVYGMPTPVEGIKVGFHAVGPIVDPDARTYAVAPELANALRDYVRQWMPGLDAGTAVPISCTYTSTASSDFVLDRHGRIVVGAGFSGHGFKFVPAIGGVLADLATDPSARAAPPFRFDGHA